MTSVSRIAFSCGCTPTHLIHPLSLVRGLVVCISFRRLLVESQLNVRSNPRWFLRAVTHMLVYSLRPCPVMDLPQKELLFEFSYTINFIHLSSAQLS